MDLIFGLDLGIASVGWSVVDDENKRIVDLGVRAFKAAETEDKGKSLNLVRRTSRLSRRRIYRRANRLNSLLNYLIKSGLISSKDEILNNEHHENPWNLRVKGLDGVLSNNQLARIIYHICKHRGFYWSSSAEETEDTEKGKIKKCLAQNSLALTNEHFRTIGETILNKYPDAQRNKADEYTKSISRVLLNEELKQILTVQKEVFHNPLLTDDFFKAILGTGDKKSGFLWKQKPPLQGEQLLKMVGHCRFEKDELRSPKANYFAERHVWLTKLLNLRIYSEDCEDRALTVEEISIVINKIYEQKSDIRYSSLTTAFVKSGIWPKNHQYKYKGLNYDQLTSSKKKKKVEDTSTSEDSIDTKKTAKKTNPESKIFYKSSCYQNIKDAYMSNSLEQEWNILSTQISQGNYDRYNRIAYILSIYKDDEEVKKHLLDCGEKSEVAEALLKIRFNGFSALSEKALKKIVPIMEQGKRFDVACSEAGYAHYKQSQDSKEKRKYLPPLFSGREPNGTLIINSELDDLPRNPVVMRVINQTRKVVNALVKKYGSPKSVHIELARDLSKTFEERIDIQKRQEEIKERRQKEQEEFDRIFGVGIRSGKNLEKYSLYKQQDCKSIYSGETIDLGRLFEQGYVEVDHVLPYSRSFNDSQDNKVLVLTKENQNKGNMLPYEYFMSHNLDWNQFEARVLSNKKLRKNKRCNLLKKSLNRNSKKEFLDRNLNDTRYACRFVKNFIDKYLRLSDKADKSGCVVVSGQLTAYLRKHWGLNKNRSENDRHHAVDATVVACCSRRMVQLIGYWSKHKERQYLKDSQSDPDLESDEELLLKKSIGSQKLYFPYPWVKFRKELNLRVFSSDIEKLKNELSLFESYTEEDISKVKTLFVSRAIQKIGRGALHADTVRSQTEEMNKEKVAVSRVKLSELSYDRISKIVDSDTRNKNLCNALKRRFEEYCKSNDIKEISKLKAKDSAKIFTTNNPMHMPNSNGEEDPLNPVVRTVRVKETFSGVPIRHGIAGNGDVFRVDIFFKEGKYYLVPIYAIAKELPNRACVAKKHESEWTVIDNTYQWCFSVTQYDLIKIELKKETYFGYFNGFDRSTGAVNIILHDRSTEKYKKGLIRSIGLKTAKSVTKYRVDVLGNYYLAGAEKRLELA